MARPVTLSKSLATADADGISTTQTPLAAGDLTITGALASGGVATMDTQRRVIITSAGNDTSKTFTIYGTNGDGAAIYEAIAGGNIAAASTTLDFLTVTRIAVSAATAGAVTAGTNGIGSTVWVAVTPHISQAQLNVACKVAGTINYTVEYTYQDVNYAPNSAFAYSLPPISPDVWPDSLVTGAAIDQVATNNDPIWASRVTVNSGSGSVTATFLQAGIAGN